MKTEHILMGVAGVVLVGGVVLYVKSKQVQSIPYIPNTGGSITKPVVTKPVLTNPILKQPLITQTTTTVITSPLTTTEKIFAEQGKLSLLDQYKGTMYGLNGRIARR